MTVTEIDLSSLQADALLSTKPEPLVLTYWKRLRRHKLATASLILLIAIITLVIIGPMIMSRMTYYNYAQ